MTLTPAGILAAHIPSSNEDGRLTLCSCEARGKAAYDLADSDEARNLITFHRTADGDLVAEGDDRAAWALHVLDHLGGPPHGDYMTVLQDDLRDLLDALGLSTAARPDSPHVVMQTEVLPAVREAAAALHIYREGVERDDYTWDHCCRDLSYTTSLTGQAAFSLTYPLRDVLHPFDAHSYLTSLVNGLSTVVDPDQVAAAVRKIVAAAATYAKGTDRA